MAGMVNKFGVGGCCCGPPATSCICCQADRYSVTVQFLQPVTTILFFPPAGWNGFCPDGWQFRHATLYSVPGFTLSKCTPSPCNESSGFRTRDRTWRGCSVPFFGTALWDSTTQPGQTTTSNVDAILVLRLKCFEEYTFLGNGVWVRTDYRMKLAIGLHLAIGTCPTDALPALPGCSYAGPACEGSWNVEVSNFLPYCGQGFDYHFAGISTNAHDYHFEPIGVS